MLLSREVVVNESRSNLVTVENKTSLNNKSNKSIPTNAGKEDSISESKLKSIRNKGIQRSKERKMS